MSNRRANRWLLEQLGHIGRMHRDHGLLGAIGERLEALSSRGPRWRAFDHRLSSLERSAALVARDPTDARHDELLARIAALETRLHDSEQTLAHLRNTRELPSVLRQAGIEMLWLAHAPLHWRPLVTVIVPTHLPDRVELLVGAVDSVLAQTYPNWELIVVDDSGLDRLGELASRLPADARIRIIDSSRNADSNPRNDALDQAMGEVIAYLDDDCRFFPWWVHSAVRALGDSPDGDVVYGVRVVEPDPRGAYTIAELADGVTEHVLNPVDTNTLVHRRRLPVRWPAIVAGADDFRVLLSIDPGTVRFVPVPASTYGTTSPDRRWGPDRVSDSTRLFTEMRRGARARRPIRIVAHNAVYPLMSETYIGDELEALRRCGVEVVLSRHTVACVPAESRVDAPLFESLDSAIDAHDPDLVLMHWATTALGARAACAAHGIPYALRTHSFDGGWAATELIDEWCAGVWTPPSVDLGHPLAHPLPTLVIDPAPPAGDSRRNGRVVSVSAGLPKKDWTTLLAAAVEAGVALDLFVAQTNGFEHMTDELRSRIDALPRSDVTLSVNVPYDEVQEAIRSASALVYSLTPDQHIGQPRSVLEAGLAATPLVVPEHPAMRATTRDLAEFHRRGDVASLAAAMRSAIDRPAPESLRLDLADRLRADHASTDAIVTRN